MGKGYYAFDLDGTLAKYDGWRGVEHIGEPVPAMVQELRALVATGCEVRVITARMASAQSPPDRAAFRRAWDRWCEQHLGLIIAAQAEKCMRMIALYDDRAIAVEKNTGRLLSPRF